MLPLCLSPCSTKNFNTISHRPPPLRDDSNTTTAECVGLKETALNFCATLSMRRRRLISSSAVLTFGSLFSLLTVVGLLGNLLVMIAIIGHKQMRRSVMNLLLLNLAIADALNLVATTAEWVPTLRHGGPVWELPAVLCPVIRYLECVFLFTSILTQLVVCVERFIAITLPLHARRLCSRNNILLTIGAIWSVVALAAFPYAMHNEQRENSLVCNFNGKSSEFWHRYKFAEFILLYLLPGIIFLTLYTKICKVLWANNRQLYESGKESKKWNETTAQMPLSGDFSTGTSRANSSVGFGPVAGAREEALKTRRAVVKMLVACVSVYFICYSPIQAIFLCRDLLHIPIQLPYEFVLLMNALTMLCSACNPLLYTLFSSRFRTRIARLLCCCCALLGCSATEAAANAIGIGINPSGQARQNGGPGTKNMLMRARNVDEHLLNGGWTSSSTNNMDEEDGRDDKAPANGRTANYANLNAKLTSL
uniref:G-protein coupled receptors family 1 profile domain-containing protein n=1 Tax=Globodera rostochiensis TaxID=31243 RepID=A0A914I5X3_GLORO